ncbi:MAG: DUF6456 domain-containing protein [Devosia sp.]
MSRENSLLRFVRDLLDGRPAGRDGKFYVSAGGFRAAAVPISQLVVSGALSGSDQQCCANSQTRGWLKRAMLDQDSFAAQHRIETVQSDGMKINLAESPLFRLAAGDAAFLEPHQVEAGERVRRLMERAQLRPRVTMSYSDVRSPETRGQLSGDMSDMAVDARRALAKLETVLPRDCLGVVLDVCGWLKGLQEVEREREWPRRSAKLVLRIGLDQLAQHYGLGPFATGRANGRPQMWMEEGARPQVFE